MKAQERHELQQNDLASWFQYGLPMFLKRNGSYLMLAAALCLLGYVLWQRHEQNLENTRTKAWTELVQSDRAEDPIASLKGVIETYDIKEVRQNAYLRLAAAYQNLALFPQDLKAQNLTRGEALTNAYETYQKVLNEYGSEDLIAGKALMGMASVEESREEWDQAKKLYEQMADKKGRFANTPIAELGDKMLESMDARKNAPRLAQNIPTQPSTNPAGLPGRMGSMPDFTLEPPTTSPATSPATSPGIELPGTGGSPFGGMGPIIPHEATTTPAPATAPTPAPAK